MVKLLFMLRPVPPEVPVHRPGKEVATKYENPSDAKTVDRWHPCPTIIGPFKSTKGVPEKNKRLNPI